MRGGPRRGLASLGSLHGASAVRFLRWTAKLIDYRNGNQALKHVTSLLPGEDFVRAVDVALLAVVECRLSRYVGMSGEIAATAASAYTVITFNVAKSSSLAIRKLANLCLTLIHSVSHECIKL